MTYRKSRWCVKGALQLREPRVTSLSRARYVRTCVQTAAGTVPIDIPFPRTQREFKSRQIRSKCRIQKLISPTSAATHIFAPAFAPARLARVNCATATQSRNFKSIDNIIRYKNVAVFLRSLLQFTTFFHIKLKNFL